MLVDSDAFEGWQVRALCRDHRSPNWWTSDDLIEVDQAKSVCMECPVRVPCVINAITDTDLNLTQLPVAGVYAGMSRLDMLMCLWKRIDDVSESNWSGPDKVIETVIQRDR